MKKAEDEIDEEAVVQGLYLNVQLYLHGTDHVHVAIPLRRDKLF